ncbi:unnamed protein product [Chondrus crispus]|uniref:Uncharacterized protein n=1 Tax=Chondrus crispus TaxID=2769 RepID=R7QH75_CHOCR|nr:unnamed protein product [Chondrus crispus]CDF37419.1 unnamed protein product [Chondrus crispus]|eukprot:XP_005717238.1 unnamed protein product [Chondrus crispus]
MPPMLFKTALLALAFAGLAQAWQLTLPKFLTSNPLSHVRSAWTAASPAWSAGAPAALAVRQRKTLNPSCVFEDLRTVGGCACFVARSRVGLSQNNRDLCRSLLDLDFEQQDQRCAAFRDSRGRVQVYRLIHIIFNSLSECNVQRVLRDTRAANSGNPTKAPSTPPRTPPPTPAPTPTTSQRPPLEARRNASFYGVDGDVGLRDGSGTSRAAVGFQPMAGKTSELVVSEKTQQLSSRMGGSSGLGIIPFSKQAVFGLLEVLSRIGNLLSAHFSPRPSQGQSAQFLKGKFKIKCRLKKKRSMRIVLPSKAIQLMLYNGMSVQVPVTEATDQEGTTRMAGGGVKLRVGVVKCKPRKTKENRIVFRCNCFTRRGGSRT